VASVRPLLGVPEEEGRMEPGVVAPEVWRLRPVQGHPPPCAGRGQSGPPGTTRTEEEIEMSCSHAKCTLCGKCLTCQPHAPHTKKR
jgi:hypothetical protein